MVVYFKKGLVRKIPVYANFAGQRIVGVELNARDLEELLKATPENLRKALQALHTACGPSLVDTTGE